MTVRWKPLIILSGVFLIIAVLGVVAITYALVPRGAGDILPLARAERKAGQFERADIHYKQALQKDGRNAEIYEEFAGMYAEWADKAPADKRPALWVEYLTALENAQKYGPTRKEPRRLLMLDGMQREESGQALHWARQLLPLDPKNADAHYVIASSLLEERTPDVPEIKRHLAALVEAKAPQVRVDWVKARLADVTGDDASREKALAACRALKLPADASQVDRMALARLRALDLQTTTATADLPGRAESLRAEVRALFDAKPMAPARTVRLGVLLERVQKSLTPLRQNPDAKAREAVAALVDAIDRDVEALFQKALNEENKPELSVYLTYADHLRFREKYEKCCTVVAEALKTPMAAKPIFSDKVMGLHSVAIEASLANLADKNRFEHAAPHIQELLRSSNQRYQGLGHLFQGAIDLELSGVSGTAGRVAQGELPTPSAVQPKLRASALNHLKAAASQLPDIAEAQARYGVALVLSREQTLGRQYLQNAIRLGNLAPQYQVWAAWSMVQAGYPEEAEPIVNQMLGEIAQGRMPHEMEGTLHLLNAEIHQARRSPQDLNLALAEYLKSASAGQEPNAAVQLRLIQIDVQLGNFNRALERVAQLRKLNQGGPPLEHLAVLALEEKGDRDEARKVLAEARKKYPRSDELAGLEAALLSKEDKPADADRVLAAFLEQNPDSLSAALMRSQLLSDLLDKDDEARTVLTKAAERNDNSAPLVQLALLDLKRRDFAAVSKTIAQIRTRWKESATGDVLDAQLSLEKGDTAAAGTYFSAALKKDPNNKLVQFWKAQLDIRTGASKDAAKAFEAIARDQPVKELDEGLTLATAAESALANLALQTGDTESAIRRFEELKAKSAGGTLRRADRWQLAAAYALKGQWPAAKREVASMLNDQKNPVGDDERVRGANFYRIHNDDEAATAQLDYVLSKNPSHTGAVVVRSYMFADAKKYPEATGLLRQAIAATPEKEKAPAIFYLMLAAVEKLAPPEADSAKRSLEAVDQGITANPDSLELVSAKYRLLHVAKDEKAAVAFVEEKAKGDKDGRFRRMLVAVYRDKGDYDAAERTLRAMLDKDPKDATAAANLVQVVVLQAAAAAEKNDRERERTLSEKAAGMIREYRARFPGDLAFLQAECDLAARRGDPARAIAVTQEMDKLSKNSPRGPLNRARLYATQGRLREAAEAYDEALERNPRQPEVRVLLGQARLRLGEADEAIRQAKLVLEVDRDQPDALLLEARALANQGGSESQKAAQADRAIEFLTQAVKRQPKFSAAYHEIAALQRARRQYGEAVRTLKTALDEVPGDGTALALLMELLTGPRANGEQPSPAERDEARALAAAAGERDPQGNLALAIAVGYHKAGQYDLALPWAQKAAAKLDLPAVHLNYGDLLLSLAEHAQDPAQAKTYFRGAVEQYDLVLKRQANSVEAINNKAWILHTYLNQSQKALDLAGGLLARVDPSTLPAEFFDTLGSIQEATGKTREAEESYTRGLRKAPENPVLNYHMGKLLAADRARASKANAYLEKARAGKERLTPTMAADLAAVLKKSGETH